MSISEHKEYYSRFQYIKSQLSKEYIDNLKLYLEIAYISNSVNDASLNLYIVKPVNDFISYMSTVLRENNKGNDIIVKVINKIYTFLFNLLNRTMHLREQRTLSQLKKLPKELVTSNFTDVEKEDYINLKRVLMYASKIYTAMEAALEESAAAIKNSFDIVIDYIINHFKIPSGRKLVKLNKEKTYPILKRYTEDKLNENRKHSGNPTRLIMSSIIQQSNTKLYCIVFTLDDKDIKILPSIYDKIFTKKHLNSFINDFPESYVEHCKHNSNPTLNNPNVNKINNHKRLLERDETNKENQAPTTNHNQQLEETMGKKGRGGSNKKPKLEKPIENRKVQFSSNLTTTTSNVGSNEYNNTVAEKEIIAPADTTMVTTTTPNTEDNSALVVAKHPKTPSDSSINAMEEEQTEELKLVKKDVSCNNSLENEVVETLVTMKTKAEELSSSTVSTDEDNNININNMEERQIVECTTMTNYSDVKNTVVQSISPNSNEHEFNQVSTTEQTTIINSENISEEVTNIINELKDVKARALVINLNIIHDALNILDNKMIDFLKSYIDQIRSDTNITTFSEIFSCLFDVIKSKKKQIIKYYIES